MSSEQTAVFLQQHGVTSICFCGARLSDYVVCLVAALKNAPTVREFLDFSNVCVSIFDGGNEGLFGACELSDMCAASSLPVDVFRVVGVHAHDVSGVLGCRRMAMVYGDHERTVNNVPRLTLPGTQWVRATDTLRGEAWERVAQGASVSIWKDALLFAFSSLVVTFAYAFCRYSEHVNGKYPNSMMPMYVLDKAIAWTALWMMIAAPLAGNILALRLLLPALDKLKPLQKFVVFVSTVLMLYPAFAFLCCMGSWLLLRFFVFGGATKKLLQRQIPDSDEKKPRSCWYGRAPFVDLVMMKAETGVIGWFFAFCHAMIGTIVCEKHYKKKWFDSENKGRLFWNNELSMMCGAVALVLLFAVTLRSIIHGSTGNPNAYPTRSWVLLRPFYQSAAPLGIWLAIFHVVLMGYKGWPRLFHPDEKNGQPSIPFVSTLGPACVLVAHHALTISGARRHKAMKIVGARQTVASADAGEEKLALWSHSLMYFARRDFIIDKSYS